jgi:hypothetical protein
MERLTVLEARKLLHGAIAASSAKETELQLMVGRESIHLPSRPTAPTIPHAYISSRRSRLIWV